MVLAALACLRRVRSRFAWQTLTKHWRVTADTVIFALCFALRTVCTHFVAFRRRARAWIFVAASFCRVLNCSNCIGLFFFPGRLFTDDRFFFFPFFPILKTVQ